jgi:ATP-dependent helicase/nuclease subunit A
LVTEGALTTEELTQLDIVALSRFWNSELGSKIRGHAASVRRELVFTARFLSSELATLTGAPPQAGDESEFIIVQGVADLVVMLPSEIWLVDFKTDRVSAASLSEKVRDYAPQLKLYAVALARIFQQPVTACWLYFLHSDAAVKVALDDVEKPVPTPC